MKRRTVALFGAAIVATLAWPGPASGAGTSLGGYNGTAQAEPIHIEVYEPTLPLPSSPQVDVSIAYSKAETDTGPVSRATASYLWPGDVLGDGFGQLVGGNATYPVQVNSRFPATATAPAKNTAQVTDGNGMTTSSNATTTTANTTGLGIAGPKTNLVGGVGSGLGSLLGKTKAPPVPKIPVPVSVSKTLATLITASSVSSESTTTLGNKTFTSTSHAFASGIDLLKGLISIKGVDVTSQTVSDGHKATTSGHATVSGLTIGGQTLSLDEKGVHVAGSKIALPKLPTSLTGVLSGVGITIQPTQTTRDVTAATGSYTAKGLVITLDLALQKKTLAGPAAALDPLIEKLPSKLGGQLEQLLQIGPKFVITLGDARTTSTASPAYNGGGGTTGGGGGTTTGGGGTTTGGGGTTTGIGPVDTGGAPVGTGPVNTGGPTPSSGPSSPGTTAPPVQSTGFTVPPLGDVPKGMIIGAIVLAGLVGWALRTFGGALLGTTRKCVYGLPTGVPDLRKG